MSLPTIGHEVTVNDFERLFEDSIAFFLEKIR